MSHQLEDYLTSIRAGIPTMNTQFDPEKDPGKKYLGIKDRLMKEPYFILP